MTTLARRAMVVTRSMSRNLASASVKDFEVKDQPEEQIFAMKIQNRYATVQYEKEDNVYDLVHSSVPDELQGKGYGKILAEKVFDYIAENNLRVKISCEFLLNFYQKNQNKYKQFVV